MRRLALVTLLTGLLICPAQSALITWMAPPIGVPTPVNIVGIPAGTTMTVTTTGNHIPSTISGTAMSTGTHNWVNNSPTYRTLAGTPVPDPATLTVSFSQDIPADMFAVAVFDITSDTSGDPLAVIKATGTGAPSVTGMDFSLIGGYKNALAGQGDFMVSVSGNDQTLSVDPANNVSNNSLLADISGLGHQLNLLSVETDGVTSGDQHFIRFGFFGAPAAVPEPSSFLFLGLIATGICGVRLRKRFWGAKEEVAAE